jgi:hypothetical protein
VGASAFIILSLVIAWMATAVRILNVKPLKQMFPAHQNLVKAHIDYILMALLLMAFYLINVELPVWIIGAMLVGGFLNPFLFIVAAMNKPEAFRPGAVFMTITMFSFVSTTVGFAGAAILVAI